MKKTRILSLLLVVALLAALFIPGTTAFADDDTGDNGMKISKTATANSNGTYTITLEAYATGEKIISDITKDVPTDIVLVLDQSGSMDDPIGSVEFTEYADEHWWGTTYHTRNRDYYEYRHNGGSANLWHKLADGTYVSVSVVKQEALNYTPITNGRNNNSGSGATNYWNNRNNLYALVNDEYLKVTISRSGSGNRRTYMYSLPDGTVIATSQGDRTSPEFTGTDDGMLYTVSIDGTQTVYTYTYTDSSGTYTIGTSTGDDTVFKPTLYQRSVNTSGGGKRLAALKTAVTTFASSVAEKAKGEDGILGTADDVDHRIAVVGFADTDWSYGYNTGVFIGSTLNRYPTDAESVYATALQAMNTAAGTANVNASINALKASGATRIDYGMTMANGILNANPIPAGQQRNRVVVVFTDGSPTSSNGFEKSVANSAIRIANTIKAAGATVYSIGIFSGADASSAGTEPSGNLGNNSSQMTAACNWFMQKVSSNNGTPRSPSYYLSASDAASLNSIFQQISDQIETGGSSTTLGESTVIRDLVAQAFTLPADADARSITLETYACTGKNGSEFTWSRNADAMGARASVSGGQVSVTGFDFAANYVGTVTENGNTSYRGNKLVIRFDVVAKDGFLGGNGVYTNDNAGIYENETAMEPVMTFERPTVDVPIPAITVDAEDKNVYLLGSVTKAQLLENATVEVGSVTLDLEAENFGLAAWQTEYVDISLTLKDQNGNVVNTAIAELEDDQTYTLTLTITPKSTGSVAAKSGSGEGSINVFKPELTYQDGETCYGASAPTSGELNAYLTNTAWKHEDTLASTVIMIGAEPTLNKSYAFEAGKIADGKVNTKQDIGVNVTVKIGERDVTEKTAFVHTPCAGMSCDLTGHTNAKFLLHVKTCQLTVTKVGGADDQPYVFTVYKDGAKYSELTIWGGGSETLYELPVGSYTVAEDAGWSWRYSVNNGSDADLTAETPSGSITCTNTKTNDSWLNGFSTVVKNIFGAH